MPYGDLERYFNLSFSGKDKRLVMIVPSLCNVKRVASTSIAFMQLSSHSFRTALSPLLLSLHLIASFVLVITIYIHLNSSIRKSYKKPSEEEFDPPRFLNAQTPITEFCRLPNKQLRESFKAN
jgi:hypothetical protein